MSSATPLTVPNLAPVSAVEAGGSQTCVTTAVGAAMKCWGRGDHGQIGNGATANPMLYPSDVLTQRWDLP